MNPPTAIGNGVPSPLWFFPSYVNKEFLPEVSEDPTADIESTITPFMDNVGLLPTPVDVGLLPTPVDVGLLPTPTNVLLSNVS